MGKRRTDQTRDDLIELARYGKLTPQEAEAKAVANGWPPFEAEPAFPAFDPMKQSRWPIIEA
jgi:hypothetical protein